MRGIAKSYLEQAKKSVASLHENLSKLEAWLKQNDPKKYLDELPKTIDRLAQEISENIRKSQEMAIHGHLLDRSNPNDIFFK